MSDSRFFRSRYLFFSLACLGVLMSSLDMSIVAVAIPSLKRSFDTSLGWIGWTITAFQLTQVIALPLAGKLSDDLGRKRVFLACVGCFTLGSLLCGLAPNIALLIVFRVVQAIGGGGLVPSAVGMVSDQFSDRRSQMIGMFTSIGPIGAILGPNVGGWILEHWTWREIFFVNVPFGTIILIGAFILIKDERPAGARGRIDYAGLALFGAAMVSFMYAATLAGNRNELRSPLLWSLVASSLLLFTLFVRQEKRCTQPILDVRMISRPPFLQANSFNFLLGTAVFGFASFVPLFAVVQYHMGSAQSGAVMTPRALATMAAAGLTSFLMVRFGYRIPMVLGMLLLSVCTMLSSFGWLNLSLGPLQLDGFWLLAIFVGIGGLGMGFSMPAANNAMLDLMPEHAAAITGMRGMFRWTGGIVAVSAVVLALSWFDDQATGLRAIFLVQSFVLLLAIPLALVIPDTILQRRIKPVAVGSSAPQRVMAQKGPLEPE